MNILAQTEFYHTFSADTKTFAGEIPVENLIGDSYIHHDECFHHETAPSFHQLSYVFSS